MSVLQYLGILAAILGTQLTRFLPFCLFGGEKKTPPAFIRYLGQHLPAATLGFLLVFIFRGLLEGSGQTALLQGVAFLGLLALHRWKKQAVLSIAGGTALYMLLLYLFS